MVVGGLGRGLSGSSRRLCSTQVFCIFQSRAAQCLGYRSGIDNSWRRSITRFRHLRNNLASKPHLGSIESDCYSKDTHWKAQIRDFFFQMWILAEFFEWEILVYHLPLDNPTTNREDRHAAHLSQIPLRSGEVSRSSLKNIIWIDTQWNHVTAYTIKEEPSTISSNELIDLSIASTLC